MDLSHMVGLWLVGQSAGVQPGGVGVVYAPPGTADAKQARRVGVYPFSAEKMLLGQAEDIESRISDVGVRAGVGLIGELEYGPEGLDGFVPRLFGAVNLPIPRTAQRHGVETTEGRDSAAEIAAASHAAEDETEALGALVNRGEASIGLSDRLAFVDRFDSDGVLGRTRVVGFVEHNGEIMQTCADVAVPAFPVMFAELEEYLRFQVAAQVAGNGYDDLAGVLAKSDRPAHAVVIVGLSTVDPHLRGTQVRLVAGDVCHSMMYDSAVASLDEVTNALRAGETNGVLSAEGVSWLRQVVG